MSACMGLHSRGSLTVLSPILAGRIFCGILILLLNSPQVYGGQRGSNIEPFQGVHDNPGQRRVANPLAVSGASLRPCRCSLAGWSFIRSITMSGSAPAVSCPTRSFRPPPRSAPACPQVYGSPSEVTWSEAVLDQATHNGEHHCRGQSEQQETVDGLQGTQEPPPLRQNVLVTQGRVVF